MKIQVGDQVRFLDDVGGGKVTALTGKEMAMVETADGFEIPAYIRNLVVVAPAQSTPKKTTSAGSNTLKTTATAFQEKGRNAPFAESDQVKGNDFPSYIFALVPQNPGNPPAAPMELFLVNDCNYTLLYHFAIKTGGSYRTLDAGTLEPNTKISLETLHPKNFSEQPDYCFQLLSFRRDATQLEEPVQKEITIAPVKLFKSTSFVKNRYFKEPAMIIKLADHPLKAELDKLTDKDFNKISAAKEPKSTTAATLPNSDLHEVDLHIEQLLDDLRGLENSDMLKVQLDHFRKEMENAITKGIKRIVFIHGVGDGVLKNELRRELQRKYAKYPFQDASFREYGFGATMVILKK